MGLGMFTVKGKDVVFDEGMKYRVNVDGSSMSMIGWTASRTKSTAEQIVWVKDGEGTCSWLLEDDTDRQELEVDPRNIIDGKRRRGNVDYHALELQLQGEERERSRLAQDSDESSSGPEAIETTRAMERTEHHSKVVSKAMGMFAKWVLSTRTPQHEEKLRRRGALTVTLQVRATGLAQGLLEKELAAYGARVAHREAGSVVTLDAAARKHFRERHLDLWEKTPVPAPLVKRGVPGKPGRVADEAAEAAPVEKRKRRAVDSESEAEAEKGPEAPAAAPPSSIEEAQKLLDAHPTASVALDVLRYLAEQPVDAAMLVRTKIGLTVTNTRKRLAHDPTLVTAAGQLVDRWKQVYRQRAP